MRHKFKMLSVAAAVFTLRWAGSVFAQEVTLPRSSHAHRTVHHTVLQPYPGTDLRADLGYDPRYGSPGGVVRYRRDPGDEFPYPVWCYDPPGACTNPFSF